MFFAHKSPCTLTNCPKIVILLFVLLGIFSCKKEIAEEISIEKYHIPQDITDYLIFKPGSVIL